MVIFLFTSCSDENAFSSINDDFEDFAGEASNDTEEKGKCKLGTSSYSDSWCCENYGYQCSYSSSSSYNSESEKCRLGTSSYSDSWCCTNYGYRCYYSSSSSYNSEAEKCRLGTSSYSDSWCCTNYGYQCYYSSSSSYQSKNYLDEPKTITFVMTSLETGSDWDGSNTKGDPEVSFTIYAISDYGDTLKTISTGILLDKSNTTSWSGISGYTGVVPAYTETIKVCPKVVNEDVIFDNDYSSRGCYSINEIGYLSDNSYQYQSDYKYGGKGYELEWYWYWYLY